MNDFHGLERGPSRGAWCVASILGIVVTLLVAAVESFPLEPRQGRGFLILALMVIVVLVVMRIVFSAAWRTLWTQPDLLIPVGLVTLGSTAIGWAMRMPVLGSLLTPSWTAQLFGLSLGVSLGVVLQILLWTAYAVWQTDLLWQWLRYNRLPPPAPWDAIRRGFWRALASLTIGVGVLLVAAIPAMALAAVALPLMLLAMGAIGVFWNLCTAALLPVSLIEPRPLFDALATGFRKSWELKRHWWLPLAAQLLLLGIVVFVSTSYTARTSDPTAGTTNVTRSTNVSFNVNAFWVGGYENQCRWHTNYMAAVKAEPVPVVSQLLGLLFLALAVAMKTTVIRELVRGSAPSLDASPAHAEPSDG